MEVNQAILIKVITTRSQTDPQSQYIEHKYTVYTQYTYKNPCAVTQGEQLTPCLEIKPKQHPPCWIWTPR